MLSQIRMQVSSHLFITLYIYFGANLFICDTDKKFMSLGINMKAYTGMSELSKKLKMTDRPDDYMIADPHVSRLISSLSQ